MDKRLKKLRLITELALNSEKSRLKELATAQDEKMAQIKALDDVAAQRAAALGQMGGADVALLAGADAKWARWRQQQRAALNIQLAGLRAKQEEQRQITKKAFGKNQVVERLLQEMAAQSRGK